MRPPISRVPAGGRAVITVSAFIAVASTVSLLAAVTAPVTVAETHGVYTVSAHFSVVAPAAIVLEVLTDYDHISRFMPGIESSTVRGRTGNTATVEQQAVVSMMTFTKRVYLMLEIEEQPHAVLFRDTCGKSFTRYEGAWRLAADGTSTTVSYELIAEPAFGMPGFLLKRLWKRDSTRMIESLEREIASRAAGHRAMRSVPSSRSLDAVVDRRPTLVTPTT